MKTEDSCVLLAAYGGPRKLDDIRPFLTAIFGTEPPERILSFTRKRYQAIGGFSPLCRDIKKLSEEFNQYYSNNKYLFKPAFRYISPTVEDSIKEIKREGRRIKQILLIPLTPFYSEWSYDGYKKDIEKATKKHFSEVDSYVARPFFDVPGFIEAWVKIFRDNLPGDLEKSFYFYSVHSLPLTDGAAKKIYPEQANYVAEKISVALGINNWKLVYQSSGSRGGEWLKPEIADEVDKLDASKYKNLVVAPIGFFSENVETLYDLDISLRKKVVEKGFCYTRLPMPLNTVLFKDVIYRVIGSKKYFEKIK